MTYDCFGFDNGQIVEMWSASQPITPLTEAANTHPHVEPLREDIPMLVRIAFVALALVGLAAVLAGVKKRRIINHLSGRTPEDARQIVFDKASQKVGPEKAEKIADRVVEKLDAQGLLKAA